MSKVAAAVVVNLSSNNASLAVPATVTVPQGFVNAGFNVTTKTSAAGSITVTATYNGVVKSAVFTVTAGSPVTSALRPPAGLSEITCTPKSLVSGLRGICKISLGHIQNSTGSEVILSSSSRSLRLPDKVVTRSGQSTVEFEVDAVDAGDGIVVEASLGSDKVSDTVSIISDRSSGLRVPGTRFVKYGTQVSFAVSTADPAATVSTGPLPDGAYFDSTANEFRWTPDGTQLGAHEIAFTAVDSAGAKFSASVTVQVDSGQPLLTGIVNAASRSREAACSPGSIATIEGRWLTTAAAASDRSGDSVEIAGIHVWANGMPVPILSASSTALDILCPDAVAGTTIQFVVQTDRGMADPLGTKALSATPGIFTVDGSGSGQGVVVLDRTGSVAMVRNYRVEAQPAASGDRVLVYATGVGGLKNVSVQVGGVAVTPIAVSPVPNYAGVYQVILDMPDLAAQNNSLLLSLSGETQDGSIVSSNQVSIAVEARL